MNLIRAGEKMDILEFVGIFLGAGILMTLIRISKRLGSISTHYVASAQLYDSTRDVTTNMPIPLAAATCQHRWDVLKEEKLSSPYEQKSFVILQCQHCGLLDKTCQSTSPPPKPVPLPQAKGECRHKWEKEQKVVLESAYEQMLKSISVKQYGHYSVKPEKKLDLDLDTAPKWMFRKCYICVRECTLCGEIYQTIAYNFDMEEGEEAPEEQTIKLKNG
jgi:hypothetical protein